MRFLPLIFLFVAACAAPKSSSPPGIQVLVGSGEVILIGPAVSPNGVSSQPTAELNNLARSACNGDAQFSQVKELGPQYRQPEAGPRYVAYGFRCTGSG